VLGHSPDEYLGKGFLDLVHPEDRPEVAAALRALVDQPGEIATLEYRRRHRNGTWKFVESTASNLLGHPAVAGIVLNSHGHPTASSAEERLLHDALHDELTGLPNRALFMDRLKQSMERSRREPERLTIVLFSTSTASRSSTTASVTWSETSCWSRSPPRSLRRCGRPTPLRGWAATNSRSSSTAPGTPRTPSRSPLACTTG